MKPSFLEFQKGSTKDLLYLMAIGHTVAPSLNAPDLNITQYSLFTQVPAQHPRVMLLTVIIITVRVGLTT